VIRFEKEIKEGLNICTHPQTVHPHARAPGLFVDCFGVHLLILTISFNSPLILYNLQFSPNSSISLPLSGLWEIDYDPMIAFLD